MDAVPLTLLPALAFLAIALGGAALAYRRTWCAPALVMASAPFAWYHQLGPTEVTLSKSAFVGAAIGVLAAIVSDPERRKRAIDALRSNRALIPLVALALWSLASALWAGTPQDAVREALKWIWYAGAFALSVASIDDPADATKVLYAMFVTAAIVGLDGLWQNATSAPAGFVAPNGAVVGRIAGTLEGPNQFGAYLESAICPLLAVLLFARTSKTVLIAASLLLGLLFSDLLLTYSRGALWSCFVAIVFLAVAYVRLPRARAQARQVPAVIVACAALVVVPVIVTSIGVSGWQHEFWLRSANDTTDSAARRGQLWTCAVELFARHPLAGVGAGNFADAKQVCGNALAGAEHFNANEWYLETAADLGVIGAGALVVFLALLLSRARDRRLWNEPAMLGAYAVLIAFVLHGFVDDVMTYPKAALSFFVLAAMIPWPPRRT